MKRAEPFVERHRAADQERIHAEAEVNVQLLGDAVHPPGQKAAVARQWLHALEAWRTWAHGEPVTAALFDQLACLGSEPNQHVHALVAAVERWAESAGVELPVLEIGLGLEL